ncbi:MAG: adenine phosphoribosyltransferase [Calditrichia bacterium]|nr:adenine phosphoribosyltransferase [Calditrichia bacterium]NOQ96610.1 adenine phosphoribosyltransferase [Calditrichia bacterium]
MKKLESFIRNIPDFPVKGIQFKDITTLLKNGELFAQAVDQLYVPFREKEINKIVGIEARGFIFAAALAYKLNLGFIPIRKPGKLPAEVESEEYNLEYGKDSIELHTDAIDEGDKILIVDDLLATGGTAAAAARLVEKLGGEVVGLSFLIELTELKARSMLKSYQLFSLLQFPF